MCREWFCPLRKISYLGSPQYLSNCTSSLYQITWGIGYPEKNKYISSSSPGENISASSEKSLSCNYCSVNLKKSLSCILSKYFQLLKMQRLMDIESYIFFTFSHKNLIIVCSCNAFPLGHKQLAWSLAKLDNKVVFTCNHTGELHIAILRHSSWLEGCFEGRLGFLS